MPKFAKQLKIYFLEISFYLDVLSEPTLFRIKVEDYYEVSLGYFPNSF
jgi:hypothetical protein